MIVRCGGWMVPVRDVDPRMGLRSIHLLLLPFLASYILFPLLFPGVTIGKPSPSLSLSLSFIIHSPPASTAFH